MKRNDPFSLVGFEFIGRERELSLLNESIKKRQSIVLYAPPGEGKTALFKECCSRYKYSEKYVVIHCDLYATCNMSEFLACLVKSMNHVAVTLAFLRFLKSIKAEIRLDPLSSSPSIDISFNSNVGMTALEEIKHYIESSPKQYLLYIDEFQQVAKYPDNNAVGVLQSFFSSLPNLVCVISGSRNRTLKELLTTKMSSFYASLTIIELLPINCLDYSEFVVKQFKRINVTVGEDIVEAVYNLLEGSIMYLQRFFSNLFSIVESGNIITFDTIDSEINNILSDRAILYDYIFKEFTPRQKEYIVKLAHGIQTSGSASYLANKTLVERGIVSRIDNIILDKFFRVWLLKQHPLLNKEGSTNNNNIYKLSCLNPISKDDRENLLISLAYLSAIEWPRSNEKALLIQLKEILASDFFCPNSLRFLKIKKYLINREEASLDSNMVSEIKQYIKDIKSYK